MTIPRELAKPHLSRQKMASPVGPYRMTFFLSRHSRMLWPDADVNLVPPLPASPYDDTIYICSRSIFQCFARRIRVSPLRRMFAGDVTNEGHFDGSSCTLQWAVISCTPYRDHTEYRNGSITHRDVIRQCGPSVYLEIPSVCLFWRYSMLIDLQLYATMYTRWMKSVKYLCHMYAYASFMRCITKFQCD